MIAFEDFLDGGLRLAFCFLVVFSEAANYIGIAKLRFFAVMPDS